MQIDTYHQAQALLDELKRQSLEVGHNDIAHGLDDVSERLTYCWSKTVKKEEDA